uniref:Uncharacterized protein n=1 Tax=viral metagenome TaxID=1070528 RepID=A0A6M3LHZ4_9ZZZZ
MGNKKIKQLRRLVYPSGYSIHDQDERLYISKGGFKNSPNTSRGKFLKAKKLYKSGMSIEEIRKELS